MTDPQSVGVEVGSEPTEALDAPPSQPLHLAILDYRDIRHPEAGGAEVYIYEIFRRIAAHGHRVTWISAKDAGADPEEIDGNLRMLRTGNKVTANFTSVRAALRLDRDDPVDLYIENLCKIPFFVPAYDAKAPVLPIVLHLFGETVFREANPLLATYVWLYERFIPRVYRGKPFVALSDSTAQDLARRGVAAKWVDVVPPGLDLSLYCESSAPSDEALVLYVGRLKRYKQIDIALRAFAEVLKHVPTARFAVLGKGDDRERLEKLVAELGLADSVRFYGFVTEQEKIEWLRKARVVVYPSPKEGWGISTTEAAACGTPVVASNSEGLRDAVQDGRTGFLVPHEDVSAWASQIRRLIEDDVLHQTLREGAIAWSREFDWDKRATQMRLLIERAAREQARNGATG